MADEEIIGVAYEILNPVTGKSDDLDTLGFLANLDPISPKEYEKYYTEKLLPLMEEAKKLSDLLDHMDKVEDEA